MIKRFSVMAAEAGLLAGKVVWEPATLQLDTSASRHEALSFVVRVTRGLGGTVAKGESFSETREGQSPLRGYDLIRLGLAEGKHLDLATVVTDEILAGAKEMRKSKPKVPQGKTVNDEVWTCASCRQKTMSRGGDTAGWKGVQMSPQIAEFTYYCSKPVCIAVRNKAIGEAKRNWGYEDTSDAEVENQSEPESSNPERVGYGPPASKPFL